MTYAQAQARAKRACRGDFPRGRAGDTLREVYVRAYVQCAIDMGLVREVVPPEHFLPRLGLPEDLELPL